MIVKNFLSKTLKNLAVLIVFMGIFSVNSLFSQEGLTVSGVVLDSENQMPIPQVSILEKGGTNGVVTDFDGNYSLKLTTENAILVFSYLGYTTKEVAVSGKKTINVTLSPSSLSLDEIVIVGYGSVKKTDLTGTVSTVDAKQLTERNVTSPLEAIQGSVPGVQISSTSGRVGDGFNIVIRGNNSLLGDGQPLYVVDGSPTNDIDFLNPQDIARMDILKDASSAAIYGSRGANGVVIITTKSGKSAKSGLNISVESSFGVKSAARLPEMMDGNKWWAYHQSAYLATTNLNNPMAITPDLLHDKVVGGSNSILEARALANDTFDWYDAVLSAGTQQNNYVNVNGRAENGLAYNLGLGMQKETGLVDNESIKKYTFKAGLDHNINDKISVGINVTIARTDQQFGSDVAMQEAFRLNPFLSPWAIDASGNEIVGELYAQPGKLRFPDQSYGINKTSTYNPLLEIQNSTDDLKRWRLLGSGYVQYKANDWLTFKSSYNANYSNSRRGIASGLLTNVGSKFGASSEIQNQDNYNYTWDNQFNITKNIGEDHSFNFLGLQSVFESTSEFSNLSSQGQPSELGYYNVGSGTSNIALGSGFVKRTISSYAARLNYIYKDKYLVTATNRWDGSSVLSKGNKWESFPSIALGWKISEEDFLSENETVSNLKARLSFGYTGNDQVDPYSTLNSLNRPTFYDFNGVISNGAIAKTLADSELTWEKTRELNLGLDFGFLSNKITGSIDVYDRLSEDLLYEQTLPLETGWGTTVSNVGSVSNKGVELLLTTRNIQTDDITWTTTFTFTKNTNKLESIYNQSEISDIGNNLHLGESLGSHYNYVADGVWQASEAAEAVSYGQLEGQGKVKDLNNDGKIDSNDDRTVLGNSDPSWSGALMSNLQIGNFDFSISAFTNQGVLAYINFHANFANTRDRGRQKLNIASWYVPENGAGLPAQASNLYPQPRNMGTYWKDGQNSNSERVGYYRDASFIKVKNITLGYNFDQEVLSKLKVKNLRVYANILNPFVFTDYEGYDPEWASSSLSQGGVGSVTFQLGLSLKF